MRTWKEDFILSTIVLETAWGLPRRGLGSIKDEWEVAVHLGLDTGSNTLIHAKQALHFVY